MQQSDEDFVKENAGQVNDYLWIASISGAYSSRVWNVVQPKTIINVSSVEPHPSCVHRTLKCDISYFTTSVSMPLPDAHFDFSTCDPEKSVGRCTLTKFYAVLDYVRECIEAAKFNNKLPIIVHCHAGINRSAACIAAHLIADCGYTSEGAIKRLRAVNVKRKTQALTNDDFRDGLKYYMQHVNRMTYPDNVICVSAYLRSVDVLKKKAKDRGDIMGGVLVTDTIM